MPWGRGDGLSALMGTVGFQKYGQTCAQGHQLGEVLLARSTLGS